MGSDGKFDCVADQMQELRSLLPILVFVAKEGRYTRKCGSMTPAPS